MTEMVTLRLTVDDVDELVAIVEGGHMRMCLSSDGCNCLALVDRLEAAEVTDAEG